MFIGGAVVQWLRDGLHAIKASGEVQALAESVPDAGGVMFVPAFTGLGAPYWNAEARGAIVGLTRGSTVAHIARARWRASPSRAPAAAGDEPRRGGPRQDAGGAPVTELRVDGGACVNDLLMQFQADLLGGEHAVRQATAAQPSADLGQNRALKTASRAMRFLLLAIALVVQG